MDPIVSLDHVSFSYDRGRARALDDVSLSIAPGEFLGVTGPSGAGKSTLAAVMAGAIPHHFAGELYGAVLVDGRDTCDATLTDISRVVGSVNQDIDAQMVASEVEDELLFGLENFGYGHEGIPGAIGRALDAVGIADLRGREIATLSGGQKQKVAIAAILALEPRVLVLDEPTAALDPASSRMVYDTLRDLNRRLGITVVVIEQKVAMLSEYCERLVIMDRGRVALDGTPREVFSHASELREIGVDSPRAARVSNSLAACGLVPPGPPCLDADEAADQIERVVRAARGDAPAAVQPRDGDTPPESEGGGRAGSPVVELIGASFSYGRGGASVDDLDMEVHPGEIVAVIGENGAGKTTLTKLLNGLLRPASGTVRIAGVDTADVAVSQIARHVSTLFQNPDRQLCRDTVLDEIAFGLELAGSTPAEARERARSVAERFGLPAGESPFSLSRGQRQMVALASVVVLDPEVVLLDEPTSGLDYRECMTVMETVADLARRGSAVVMVCHDMEVVSDFADRLVVMARGRIVGRGPAGEVFRDAGLMERAGVAAPDVVRMAERLARELDGAYARVSEVSEIVRVTRGLVEHA